MVMQKQGNIADLWSSILTQKANDETSKLITPPYIHPLVKKSKNSLSEKSLEICTESLGSETGSDGFSFSYPPFETEDNGDEKLKYHSLKKSSLPRCFPPPLSSSQHGGPSPHIMMKPYRDNGRLCLQVVSIIPSNNNFSAKRKDGRLVLTFASEEEEEEDDEEEKEEEEKDNVDEVVMEQGPMLSSVPRFASIKLRMNNKPIGLVNIAKPSFVNGYDKYYGRTKLMGNEKINELASASIDESQELLVVRGKSTCKDFRRSFLFSEERCCSIATT